MTATQRLDTQEALVEPSGEHPLWKDLPSWSLIATEDRRPPSSASRPIAPAGRTLEIPGASHAAAVPQSGVSPS